MGAIFFIMGAIQIRKLNYSQVSLQLLQKTFGEFVKKNLGLTRWLRVCGADSFYRENCNMGAFGKMFRTQTQNAKLLARAEFILYKPIQLSNIKLKIIS